jgi:RNA polymerase sigma factor (sigma-70 family)
VYRSDPSLIQACLSGDKAAWDALVERYGRLVYSIPRRYGLSTEDADDVFQNVFLSAYRSLDKLKDQSRLSSWLITTAHRECWRTGKRGAKSANLDEHIENVAAPRESDLVDWERQHLVRQGLTILDGRCQPLLEAMFFDSTRPDYETIAKKLNMRMGSIGPTRARCFNKLQKILTQLGLTADPGR